MDEEEIQSVINDGPIEVMIGELVLPVPPRSMRIRKSAKIDEIEIPGRSGKVKMAVGYEDAEIELKLEVCAEEAQGRVVKTARDRVEMLYTLFKPSDDAVPLPVPIVSTLTETMQIKSVLAKDIAVSDHPEFDYYDVDLALIEFESVTNQLDRAAAEEQVTEEQVASDPRLDDAMGSQEDRYLVEQAERGYNDANGSFTGDAPGADNG